MTARLEDFDARAGRGMESGRSDAVRADQFLSAWSRCGRREAAVAQFLDTAAELGLMTRARPARAEAQAW
jgi:hypothetical protein